MTTLVVLAFAIPLAILTHSVVGQNAEKATEDQARNAAEFLRTGPSQAAITSYVKRQTSDTGRPMSVLLPDGTLIGSTPGPAPRFPLNEGRVPGGFPGEIGEATFPGSGATCRTTRSSWPPMCLPGHCRTAGITTGRHTPRCSPARG